MKCISRRVALQGAIASTAIGLFGCGGGEPLDGTTADAPDMQAMGVRSANPSAADLLQTEAPAIDAAKYRSSQRYLFQTIPAANIPPRISGSAYSLEQYGPTREYVDKHVGWPWDQAGGDWIDAGGVRHGTAPWFAAPLNAVKGNTASAAYAVDATMLVNRVQAEGRPLAILLTRTGAARSMAALKSATPPRIDVSYADGESATLDCRVTALSSSSTSMPVTMGPKMSLPCFLEFEQPCKPVVSATLHLMILEHWSGASELRGWLLDPPKNTDPVRLGVAQQAGPLDLDIDQLPSIIGAHRYLDGTALADFALPGSINVGAEREFDPAIWGNGASDTTKLPHRGLGKWINVGANDWSVVGSGYEGEGFQALAPGCGALRIHMPATPGLLDGSLVGYSGTAAANAYIYLPEHLFGRLDRIFVRHYFRLGSSGPYAPGIGNRLHVYQTKQADGTLAAPAWTDAGGKFGIMPEHTTSVGGVSGSAGGGNGWQMRMSWSDCDAGMGGPDEGGWSAGYHLYDFWVNQPQGYSYYGDNGRKSKFGQRGGLGGILYANQWYCMESELKLNTVMSDGPGFLPDGEIRTWIDGHLAFERTGMVFRTLPIADMAYNATKLRPCRELGIRGLWFNWFHGGKTKNVVDRTMFVTGLAWGHEYIGPMSL
jgi:hypothetical protein